MTSSILALGTWQYGPSHGFWTDGKIEQSKATIRLAYSHHIRHFDTAPSYGNGLSEQLLASVLSPFDRKDLHISTKFMPKTPSLVAQDLQKSLARLKTSSVDTLYLHWPSRDVELRPILQAAMHLVDQGLAGSIGVCNTPLWLLQEWEDLPIKVIQIPCSLLWVRDMEAMRTYARKRGISMVGYSPLGLGLLAGTHMQKPQDDRKHLYVYDKQAYPAFLSLLEVLHQLADEKGCTPAQIALLWALNQGFSTILVGSRNPEQLAQLLAVQHLSLDETEKSRLDEKAEQMCSYSDPSQDNLFGHRW